MRFIKPAMVIGTFLCALVPAFGQAISLEQVIKEVCTNGDSAKMMRETLKKSGQMVSEKWSNALPTVSASVNASRLYQIGAGARKDQPARPDIPAETPLTWGMIGDQLGSFMGAQTINYYTTSLSLSQPLYTFGKIGTAVAVAREFDSSARYAHTRNVQQLQLTALDAFYQTLLSNLTLAVSRRSLARKQELSDFLTRNFALGSGNKAYLLSTQADVNSQQSDIITAGQNARNAKLRLSAFMGRALTDSLQLDTTSQIPGLFATAIVSEQEALKMAEEKREDLKALGCLAQANQGGAKIYNAMYLPSIGLQASIGTGGSEPKDITDWDRRNWMVGVGLQWTLFDGLANHARAQQYQSDARKLEIAGQSIRKMIEIEVKSALAECAAADSNLVASRKMLAASQEAYDIANDNFKQGSGQFSDLQLADERLQQAELGGMNARYRQVRSRAALRISLGIDIVKLEEK